MAHPAPRMRPLTVALLLASAACSRPVPVTGATPDAPADSVAEVLGPTVLTVVNHHWSDVVITVTHGGLTSRLGSVSATTSAGLTIPATWINAASSITVTARALGGARRGSAESYQTRPIMIRAGQQLELTLESGLQRSSIAVF